MSRNETERRATERRINSIGEAPQSHLDHETSLKQFARAPGRRDQQRRTKQDGEQQSSSQKKNIRTRPARKVHSRNVKSPNNLVRPGSGLPPWDRPQQHEPSRPCTDRNKTENKSDIKSVCSDTPPHEEEGARATVSRALAPCNGRWRSESNSSITT